MEQAAHLADSLHARDHNRVPAHVAIVMDGNGRWAEQRGLPRLMGHRVGVDNIRPVLQALAQKGVKYVSLYAFSTENWNRPATEVEGLMDILRDSIEQEAKALHEQGVRILHLGRLDRLSPELHQSIVDAQELTRCNKGITLSVAFDYGGRAEIVEAVKNIMRDGLSPEQLNEECIARYLYTSQLPDPDLIIRTGGELRLSNFFLWQAAYSEYYPTPTLWPDLGPEEVARALEDYGGRQRRFGNIRNGA